MQSVTAPFQALASLRPSTYTVLLLVFAVLLSPEAQANNNSVEVSGIAATSCRNCDPTKLEELKFILSKQVTGPKLSTGSQGHAVVIRDGERVKIGVFNLFGTGSLVATDHHVLIRHAIDPDPTIVEKKDGHVETQIVDRFGTIKFKASDDGKVYFEPFHHPGRKNLIEVNLKSIRRTCPHRKDAATTHCDGVEARLTQSVFDRFPGDDSLYAALYGFVTNHDDMHRNRSLYFVSAMGKVWSFNDCKEIGDAHPSFFPELDDQVFFHSCPSNHGDSGTPILLYNYGRRYLVALHTNGPEKWTGVDPITGRKESRTTPKIGIALTPERIQNMDTMLYEEMDARGINPNDERTWPAQ